MRVERFFRFLKGYVLVELQGNALEKLINRLSNSGIALWEIERIKHGFQFKIFSKDFHYLRPLIRYRKCSVRIIKKYGWPFIKYRTKRRKAMLVGIFLFFLILKTFSLFLWDIDIIGNEKIFTSELEQIIYQSGVRPGIMLHELNLADLEQTILIKDYRVSWVHASLQGTKLKIKIVEKELINKTELTDIIARRSGVITHLTVMQGKAMVKVGDTVKEGQVLIKAANKYETFAEPDYSGALPPYLPPIDEKPDPALGIIQARVWYEGYGEADLVFTKEILTGKRERVLKMKIGTKIFHLSGPKQITYEHYQVENDVKSISLWRNINLPIEILKEDYLETAIYCERRSQETATFIAQEQALSSILNSMASNAIIIQARYFIIDETIMENNIVRVKAVFEVEENIATPLPR